MNHKSANIYHHTLKSQVLTTARYKIPVDRPVMVYEPCRSLWRSETLPVLYYLASWTQAGRTQLHWQPFRESLPDRLDRLISSGQIPPCYVVCPDLYTEFGGSQYVDSSYLGDHARHIVEEVIPFVETNYPVAPGARHRGVFGISSGGFGGLRLAMDYDDVFHAVACHSGDMGFELVYGRDLPVLAAGLAAYEGSAQGCFESLMGLNRLQGSQIHLLMLLGMAATYSPDPKSPDGFALPIDLHTGLRQEQVWARWLSHDPIERLANSQCQERLAKLGALHIECGSRDQYFLHFGARQFVSKLESKGIRHHYQEFDGTHSGLSWRLDHGLAVIAPAIGS